MLRLFQNAYRRGRMPSSSLFNERTFYANFLRDLRRANKHVVIESPYLTERRALYYTPIFQTLSKRGVRVMIHTRHFHYHDANMRIQAEKAAQALSGVGVQIYTFNDLRHWKIAAIDNAILWEGSLNVLSHSRSREVMRRIASPALCKQTLAFINCGKKGLKWSI